MQFSFEPEEFKVEEIGLDGRIFELKEKAGAATELVCPQNAANSQFCCFVLQKRQWNTTQAIQSIARGLGISFRRFNFAGTKDRNAITTQLCSCFGLSCEELKKVDVKDLQINECFYSSEKVDLGHLLGNRFTIVLNEKNCGKKVDLEKIIEKAKECNFLIKNFFGDQRFGSVRRNTHLIGLEILKGDFKKAVLDYLTFSDENETDEESRLARQKLGADLQKKENIEIAIRKHYADGKRIEDELREKIKSDVFKSALQYYPMHLKFERTLLGHLAQTPTDFVGAFRKMPRQLQLMFIHAFQSHLFNEVLKPRKNELNIGDFVCNKNSFGFPDEETAFEITAENWTDSREKLAKKEIFLLEKLTGFDSILTAGEENALKEFGLSKESFVIKSMPELSCKGTMRPAFVEIKKFSASLVETGVEVKFELSSGSYATVAIEFLIA